MPMSELFKEEYDYEYEYPIHGLSVSVSEDGSKVDVRNLNKIESKSGNDHCNDAKNQASWSTISQLLTTHFWDKEETDSRKLSLKVKLICVKRGIFLMHFPKSFILACCV